MAKASLICSQHIVNRSGVPEQACHAAATSHFERLLLLSSEGEHGLVTGARLLVWGQLSCSAGISLRPEQSCCSVLCFARVSA